MNDTEFEVAREKLLLIGRMGSYALNGYLIIPDVISAKRCAELLALAEMHADENFSAIMNLDRKVPEFRELMTNPKIIQIMEELQGKPICALMSQILFKKARSPYASQAWNPHQDNSYPRAKPGTYLTINIFFEDSDRENGGLYVYPGSQREGIMPFEPTLSYHEKPGTNPGNHISEKLLAKYPTVDLEIPKGSMIILNGELAHGSYPNRSATRSRALFSASYVNEGEPFWPGSPERSDKRVIFLHPKAV